MFFLAFQVTFSQVKNRNVTSIKNKFFEAKLHQSTLTLNETTKNIFPEILNFDLKDIKNNSEGKFTPNNSNKKCFMVDETSSRSSIFSKDSDKVELNSNLTTSVKKEFINTIHNTLKK